MSGDFYVYFMLFFIQTKSIKTTKSEIKLTTN